MAHLGLAYLGRRSYSGWFTPFALFALMRFDFVNHFAMIKSLLRNLANYGLTLLVLVAVMTDFW